MPSNPVDSQEVTLDAGQSTQITLEWSSTSDAVGDWTAEVESDDDTATSGVTVEETFELTWNNDGTDWDAAQAESGVVHESTANTDHDNASLLKQGYSAASPSPSNGLVAYWPMHEDSGTTMYDHSANTNDGTINGATVETPALLGTTGYSFDGTDDYALVDHHDSLSFPGDFSISLWINYDGTGSDLRRIISKWEQNNEYQFWIDGTTDEVTIETTPGFTSTGYTVQTGVWTHLVWVHHSGANDDLYADGVIESSASLGDTTTATDTLAIGATDDGSGWQGHFLGATLADIRLYNRALTDAEVQALYDTASTGTLTTGVKTS